MSEPTPLFDTQRIGEVKPYTSDFTSFIRTGSNISSVAGSYAQTFSPAGSALASGSCAASSSGASVTIVSPALVDTGQYAFAATATMSNGDVRSAIWFVKVDR